MKKKTILYLGQKSFPVGLAATQRQLQISKALKNDETRVLVINRKGSHSAIKIQSENIGSAGSYEGIDYLYSSGTPLYIENFSIRNLQKIWGAIGELFLLLFYGLTKNVTFVVSTSSLSLLKYYWTISRILHIKLVYDYVEYFSSLEDRSQKVSTQKKSFDTEFYKYTDSLIIISSFLEQHVKSLTSKPYIIVPPIIDFEKFASIHSKPTDSNYFLYCGSSQYLDVIQFIMEAFRKTDSVNMGVTLILVVNGNQKKITKLKKAIENDTTIKIISNLTYERLIGYYKNARALLIPLQDNLQDKARFPFKISEYTAAARPIVTSDSGAIVDYFQDMENALLAKTEDANDFATKLNFILKNPDKAEQIAQHGHALGQKVFNYKSYSSLLSDFCS